MSAQRQITPNPGTYPFNYGNARTNPLCDTRNNASANTYARFDTDSQDKPGTPINTYPHTCPYAGEYTKCYTNTAAKPSSLAYCFTDSHAYHNRYPGSFTEANPNSHTSASAYALSKTKSYQHTDSNPYTKTKFY